MCEDSLNGYKAFAFYECFHIYGMIFCAQDIGLL